MEVSEFKFNDVKNEPKPFGFHIATINNPISYVLIKRVWKKRRNISKYVLKKSYKKKTKDKRSIKIKEGNVENTKHLKGETLDPNKFTGDRKWCWDEFERHIGVPKRKDTPPSIATAYIRRQSYRRLKPEAKILEKPKQKDSVFLTRDKSRSTSRCLCPDRECLCFGTGIIHEYKKIPKNPSTGILKEYLNNLMRVCRKKVNINDFLKKIIEATNASEKEKQEMYMDVILRQELCLSRCIYSHVPEELPDVKYRLGPDPKKKRKEEKKKEESKDDEELDKLLDDRVCNVVDCTVSTQTDNTPDGELIMGHFSHLLYSNNQETFLKDIRGKKLQISHYTHVCPKPPDLQVYAKNMEKLLNFKEMKDRLCNLISSIYVIKEPGPPVRTSATQVPVRHGRILKFCTPNRSGDEDYENLKEVPWKIKMQEAIFDEMRRYEIEEEQKDNVCPCCEYFADSAIDKNALFEKMRSVLTLPGDNRIGESITIAKKIIEEIADNAFDDFYEEGNNKENVDELLSSFINEEEASDETLTKETDNNKKTVECECFSPKKPTSSKSVAQKLSESIVRRIKLINERIAKINSFDTDVEKKKDEIELKPSNDEMNNKSSIENSKNLNAERVSFDTKNTPKDRMVLQVNTSYKKASSSSSSLFKWLFGSPTSLTQIIKTSSVKSATENKLSTDVLSTDILCTDKLSADTNFNLGLKSSEREVFSIRYTSSAISVNKGTSFETDK